MNFTKVLEKIKNIDQNLNLSEFNHTPIIPSFIGVQAGQSLNHLTVHASEFYNLETVDYKTIEASFNTIGKPIAGQGLFYKTRAGLLNANPALIFTSFNSESSQKNFTVFCLAKEGWINQKTATKAIKRFEMAISHQGVSFKIKTIIPLTRLDSINVSQIE